MVINRIGASAFFLFCFAIAAHAQVSNVRISVVSLQPARVAIEGEWATGTNRWAFSDRYGAINRLAERIENFAVTDEIGASIAVRRIAAGEYEANRAATRFRYEVELDAPVDPASAAQVSWLNGEHGFLMLGDLLPRGVERVRIHLTLPERWNVVSVENRLSSGEFETSVAARAVFLVGRNLREQRRLVDRMEFTFAFAGDWAFTEAEAANAAASILREHRETMGDVPVVRAAVLLAPFPRPTGAERWSAETRGGTVVFISGRMPSGTAGLGKLSVSLAHELFHLWLPNGLALDGNYDWFYEGFTLYQAARASVRLGFLTFQDHLDAVARAYDAHLAMERNRQTSLVEASRRRWDGANEVVYNKGMLVAFLYDLALMEETNRRQSLRNVYRELFQQHNLRRAQANVDANRSVLEIMNRTSAAREFTRRYVEGADVVDLATMIVPYGLQVERFGARTRITVAASPSRAQRNLLRDFGYNSR